MYYALGAVAAILVVQIVLLVRVARALSGLAQLDGRVSRLAEAMALLTDTAETGFRSLGDQARAAAVPGPAASRRAPRAPKATSTGRVVRAARRGKTVSEIAAAEEVSEGEVRLRLSLADAAGRSTAHEVRHGALRME